jgi:hypothetical protein
MFHDGSPHIVMRDAHGEVFAVAILERPHLIEMLEKLIAMSHQILDYELRERNRKRTTMQ